eukprot:12346020-Alexandrium_andersonii.AAC.1
MFQQHTGCGDLQFEDLRRTQGILQTSALPCGARHAVAGFLMGNRWALGQEHGVSWLELLAAFAEHEDASTVFEQVGCRGGQRQQLTCTLAMKGFRDVVLEVLRGHFEGRAGSAFSEAKRVPRLKGLGFCSPVSCPRVAP